MMKRKFKILISVVTVMAISLGVIAHRGFESKASTAPAYEGGTVAGVWTGSGDTEYSRIVKTSLEEFEGYKTDLTENGYTQVAENDIQGSTVENYYATYQKDNHLVHVTYIGEQQATMIVDETVSALPDFGVSEENPDNVTLTQLHIEEIRGNSQGMSYIYKLSDGSFFVIDGGDAEAGYEQAKHTYEVLQTLAGGTVDNPVSIKIAAWLFTHPHSDHYLTFCDFLDCYGEKIGSEIVIEQLIYNFPKASDILSMGNSDVGIMEDNKYPRFERLIAKHLPDVEIVKPHSGYEFHFGGVTVEILLTYEDWRYTKASIPEINSTSLIFSVTVSGQKTLFLGDSIANYGSADVYSSEFLAEMYGDYLKADILQVAHHGLNGSTVDLQKYIDAEYLLLPARNNQYEEVFMNAYDSLTSWPPIKWGQNVYMRVDESVKEIFVAAHGDTTLELPYYEDKGSVYGEGISVVPSASWDGQFKVVEKTVTEGENAGKKYTRITDVQYDDGYSYLTISATEDAQLEPNTEYNVSVDVVCDGTSGNLSYHDDKSDADRTFILRSPGGQINFTITTDDKGTFTQTWTKVWLNSSSGWTYLDFTNVTITKLALEKTVALTVGADETQRNVTWYIATSTSGKVQYAVKDGEDFPAAYKEAIAESAQTGNDEEFYSNQATLVDLQPNTEYVYRVVNGTYVSETYSFKTSAADKFSFLLAGDPQIGESGIDANSQKWEETLNTARDMFPDSNLLITTGDQVNLAILDPDASNWDPAKLERQYAGYLRPAAMQSLTNATVIGNHDTKNAAYTEHFNNPNTTIEGTAYGATTAGCDYWYTYNNTLFLHLNTNNTSTAEHKAFMEKAITANPDVNWKIVVLHHSIYSAAGHAIDSDIINRRDALVPVFTELDVDVVLMGHDHVYVRSYMMNNFTPDTSNGVETSVKDPTGILYITANSASGSKYYDLLDTELEYAAVKSQEYKTSFSNIEVTENSFKITTYRVEDGSMLDTFEIKKTQ